MRSEHRPQGLRLARLLVVAVSLLAPGVGTPHSAEQPDFLVLVNADNPVTALTTNEISRLFLKKVTTWDDGQLVQPVDQPAESTARIAFTDVVLRRKPAAVRSYWQQRIFSGRDVPPPVCGSDAEVVRFVEDNRGAIGYVGSDARPGPGVRAIAVTGDGS